MTVTSELCAVTRNWTGVETVFDTGFKARAATHCRVSIGTTVLDRGTHYTSQLTVAGILQILPLPGMPAAPATLLIERVTPSTQENDLVNGDTWDMEAFEGELDGSAMRDAEVRRIVTTAQADATAALQTAQAALDTIDDLVAGLVPGGSITNARMAPMAPNTFKMGPIGSAPSQPIDGSRLNALSVLQLPVVYASRADAVAADNAGVNNIQLLGYWAAGDGGEGATYVRIADPGILAPWQFRDAGGSVFELRTKGVHQYLFGARNDLFTNAQPAFQAAADYAAFKSAAFYGAPGNFLNADPILLRPGPIPDADYGLYERGPSWRFDNNCYIRASTAMAAIVQGGDHTYENIIWDGRIEGGQFDQNNLASRGVWVTFLNKCVVRDAQTLNFPAGGCGIQFGTTTLNEFGTLAQSYEGFAQDCRIVGTPTSPLVAARAGTTGVRYINCTDNQSRDNIIQGVLTGISGDFISGWDGKHAFNHFWNWSENGPRSWSYDLYGDNKISDCQDDGPFLYCARFRGPRNHVTGHKVNYGSQPGDADIVAALWRLEQDATNGTKGGVVVTNSGFKATASKRIAAELSLGAGCTREDFAKDDSNRYINVNNIEPVSIGNCLSGRTLISGSTATLQGGSNNIASIFRNAAGNHTINFLRGINTAVPITCQVITNGVFQNIAAVEDTTARTATSARFFFYNGANSLVDPGGYVVSATSLQ